MSHYIVRTKSDRYIGPFDDEDTVNAMGAMGCSAYVCELVPPTKDEIEEARKHWENVRSSANDTVTIATRKLEALDRLSGNQLKDTRQIYEVKFETTQRGKSNVEARRRIQREIEKWKDEWMAMTHNDVSFRYIDDFFDEKVTKATYKAIGRNNEVLGTITWTTTKVAQQT